MIRLSGRCLACLKHARCRTWVAESCADESGHAQVEFLGWFIGMGLPVVYLVITLASVQSTAFGVQSAADAAARVLSVDSTSSVREHAAVAARISLDDQHVPDRLIDQGVQIRCTDRSCSQADVDIEIPVALPMTGGVIDIPFVSLHAHRSVLRDFGA